MQIKKDDEVYPKTAAGLQLADVPTDGNYQQKRNITCVLVGKGTVIDILDIVIDYDTWPDPHFFGAGLGKVAYRNCLIRLADGSVGWAGEGALVKNKTDQLT